MREKALEWTGMLLCWEGGVELKGAEQCSHLWAPGEWSAYQMDRVLLPGRDCSPPPPPGGWFRSPHWDKGGKEYQGKELCSYEAHAMTDIAPRQRNANWHFQSKVRGQHNFSSLGPVSPLHLTKLDKTTSLYQCTMKIYVRLTYGMLYESEGKARWMMKCSRIQEIKLIYKIFVLS